MIKKIDRNMLRRRIHERYVEKVKGSSEKPRLCVYRSGKHIYAQLIDDLQGKTLVQASTTQKELKKELENKSPLEQAQLVGGKLAELAKAKKISEVAFDRGGYRYHGRVAALAQGAREKGLNF